MEENLGHKKELIERIILFYKRNKKKTLITLIILPLLGFTLFFINNHHKVNNELISEKYTQANIFISKNENEKAKEVLDKIILSENKFYSLLALNRILEKNLETNNNKILQYFDTLERIKYSQETSNLIKFKKSLYLLSIGNTASGEKLLNSLIAENSIFKEAAKEIIEK